MIGSIDATSTNGRFPGLEGMHHIPDAMKALMPASHTHHSSSAAF